MSIKRIFIEVNYTVAYEDLDVPENVKQELIEAAENGHNLKSESLKYPAATEWLNHNVKERDSLGHDYEIRDIKE